MANAGATRFLKNLCAAYCRWSIADQTKEFYLERLSRWSLKPEQWSRALSRIIAEITDDSLPALGDIYKYLKAASAETGDEKGDHVAWLLFTLDGARYARRVPDPMHVPKLPIGATDPHLALPPSMQYRGDEVRVSQAEINELVRGIG